MITVRPSGQPLFVTLDEAMDFHSASLAAWGGREGLRDFNLLDSALSMARQGFGSDYAHDFPFGMAAAYGFHIAKNHPFTDGNKRTAFICMAVFLRKNGYALQIDDAEAAQRLMLDLIEQGHDKAWLAGQLANYCRPLPTIELRQFFATMSISEYDAWAASAGSGPQPAVELLATTNEAIQHIPLLGTLVVRVLEHREAGRMAESNELSAQCMALIAMFRAAENAGYEW